jgi:protein-S-isoprenylcysteine O-methyltransferase Ste14
MVETTRAKSGLNRNLPVRIAIIFLFLIPFIFYADFFEHFYAHFMGTIYDNVITDQWHLVAINIILFLSFLLPLFFRRKINWKEFGLVTAFFVSLFIEMYGIPLTMFFASEYFSGPAVELPGTIYEFNFLGVHIEMTVAMIYGTILMVLGTIIILIAWVTLYKNVKENGLVTTGIYSYSRHPQYFGFILIVLGWVVGWPTILTMIFAPILIFMYIRVSKIEDRELEVEDDGDYETYKSTVPFFF